MADRSIKSAWATAKIGAKVSICRQVLGAKKGKEPGFNRLGCQSDKRLLAFISLCTGQVIPITQMS